MMDRARRVLSVTLAVLMTCTVTACTGAASASNGVTDEEAITEVSIEQNENLTTDEADVFLPVTSEEPELVGGWSVSESTEVTDEVWELVENATDGLLGVGYEPVAYLGSQVVAGSNHCVLCKATVVVPNAKPYYVLMYIYRDLEGKCSILKIEEIKLGV